MRGRAARSRLVLFFFQNKKWWKKQYLFGFVFFRIFLFQSLIHWIFRTNILTRGRNIRLRKFSLTNFKILSIPFPDNFWLFKLPQIMKYFTVCFGSESSSFVKKIKENTKFKFQDRNCFFQSVSESSFLRASASLP